MGNALSASQRRGVTDLDRAILALKTQRRRIEDQRKKFMSLVERDFSAARALVALQQRERALLALKKKRLHEQQLDRLDAWLLNVEGLLANMESVAQQNTVFKALAQGTQELKQLQQELSLEQVEQLLEDNAEAKIYEDQLRTMMGASLTGEDDESARIELLKLEQTLAAAVGIADIPTSSHRQPTGQHGLLLDAKEGEEETMHLPSAPSHVAEPARGGGGGGVCDAKSWAPAGIREAASSFLMNL